MKSCGTHSGYVTHIKNKEKPCDACRMASNEYRRNKRKKDNDLLGYDPRRFKKHHITKKEYDLLFLKHDGRCWICKKDPATHIDHNHECCPGSFSCGRCIRGILCSNCNTGIGLFKDSSAVLKQAIKYLDQER